jgi:uncharacterized membrane protein YccC
VLSLLYSSLVFTVLSLVTSTPPKDACERVRGRVCLLLLLLLFLLLVSPPPPPPPPLLFLLLLLFHVQRVRV